MQVRHSFVLLVGAVVGGGIVQLGVVACGNVANMRDAGAIDTAQAAADTQAADGMPDTRRDIPSTGMHLGFSYHTNGFAKAGDWGGLIVDVADYNTFTPTGYDVTSGAFTAPLQGYYRFSAHGYSPTPTAASDTRVAVALVVNGHRVAMSGGQLSQFDTPLPSLVHTVSLVAGDVVTVESYTTTPVQFGGLPGNPVYAYYFQGEYVGM